MASDFSIGFDWKSYKTDYQEEYLSDVKKNVFIEQKWNLGHFYILYIPSFEWQSVKTEKFFKYREI